MTGNTLINCMKTHHAHICLHVSYILSYDLCQPKWYHPKTTCRYVEQLVSSVEAAVEEVIRRGVIIFIHFPTIITSIILIFTFLT